MQKEYGGDMKIRFRKLLAGLLLSSLVTGVLTVPAAAAVREDSLKADTAVSAAASAGVTEGEAFISERTEIDEVIDSSGLTWKKVGNNLRLRTSKGKYKKGFVKYKGKLYYFNSKGNLKVGFFTVNGKKYYASYKKGAKGKGQILTGIVKIGSYFYYLNPSSKPHAGAVTTGFQKISGHLYYFDAAGHMHTGWFKVGGVYYYGKVNKGGPYGSLVTGVQQIGGKYYNFDSKGKYLGEVKDPNTSGTAGKYKHVIDVSEHQGTINFNSVKASGVSAVIIRAGYGSSTKDKKFDVNIKNAKAAGLPVGIYWFSYAYTKAQAVKEANYCMKVIKGYGINLPVYFDWEYDSMDYAKKKMGKKAFNKVNWRNRITEMTQAFCSTLTSGGYRAGYYFNLTYITNYYDASKLKGYSTWYAYWGKNKPNVNSVWAFANTMTVPTQYDLWQFTSKGNAPGIAGLLDCDLLLNNSILK